MNRYSEQHGTIHAISISRKKGTVKVNVPSALLLPHWGIEGDAHAGKWHRQVSLLSMDSVRKMRAKGLNIRPGAFAENLTLENVDLSVLRIGDQLKIGSALLRITQIGKECHTRCAIYYAAGDCVMPREGLFAEVLEGGPIHVNEPVTLLPASHLELEPERE
ncbi:MAG: MOSC domain-containing protein [Chlorobi bacterium]|nr:MOSC domain-containing protein [Chlorobiota bacterium]